MQQCLERQQIQDDDYDPDGDDDDDDGDDDGDNDDDDDGDDAEDGDDGDDDGDDDDDDGRCEIDQACHPLLPWQRGKAAASINWMHLLSNMLRC